MLWLAQRRNWMSSPSNRTAWVTKQFYDNLSQNWVAYKRFNTTYSIKQAQQNHTKL